MTSSQGAGAPAWGNPLATAAQIACEKATLGIEQSPAVQAVRESMRGALLADPGAQIADGRASLDRVLDQWIRHYVMGQLTLDQDGPCLLWVADNTPRTWFGHTFPGDIVAGDNPDNTNRAGLIDGDSAYELVGRYGTPRAAQFSLNLARAHDEAVALGEHLATLTDKDIVLDADGGFRVTIDAAPADGRPNHMQSRSGLLNLAARDSRSDWAQQATAFDLKLVGGPGARPAASQAERIAQIVEGLPAFVDAWRRFKDGFLGAPEPNRVVMPKRRDSEGGWGFLGGGRFRLAADEALIVTTTDAGADYTGFQITDPWTLRPETVLRTSSLNKTQSRPNPDGSCTYVVALQDPGVANWIDTGGLREGWFQLRWQNVPAGGDPTAQARLVALCDLEEALAPDVPRADLAYRRRQVRERVQGMALRTVEQPFDIGRDLGLPHRRV